MCENGKAYQDMANPRDNGPFREVEKLAPCEQELSGLVCVFLILVMALGASLTVVTHIAQIFGMSFSMYAITGVCVAIIVSTLVLRRGVSKHSFLAVTTQPMATLVLLMCGLMGALLSLVSHRPNLDDFDYVPNVVYYLENPDEPMGFKIHYLDSGGEPFVSHHQSTSLPFEQIQGIVAHMTGMHFLTVYYFFAPVFFGGMIPLVWFYVISRFNFPSRAAIAGAIFICLSLLLMGEQHRSFGKFTFNRIFQGKTVLLAVGIPLFVAFTMDFFRSPSVRRWLYLFITSVAMVGCSNSAAVLLPLLASVLFIACFVSYVPNISSGLLRGFYYLCALFYPALYAGSILLLSLDQVGKDSVVNRGFPVTFLGHFKLVLYGPAVGLFLVFGTILAIIFVQTRHRRFLITWIVSLIMFYLNPVVAPFLIEYVTSPNIYWRLFYLYPFPLVVGLSGAAMALRLENKSPKWRRIIFCTVMALLLAAHLPASSSSVFRHGPRITRLSVPQYKVMNLHKARKVLALSPPPGAMLAPAAVSQPLPMLSSKYPQMCTRRHSILMWMPQRGTQAEAIHRIRASDFLGGKMSREGLKSLVWIIRRSPQIRSIVAYRRVAEANNSHLFPLLRQLGFTEAKLAGNLVVFIRPAMKNNFVR